MYKQALHLRYTMITSFLMMILFLGNVCAQSRITVVIPEVDTSVPARADNYLEVAADADKTEIAKSFFKFDLNNLPLFTDIEAYNLRLYVNTDTKDPNFKSHTITVVKGDGTETGDKIGGANVSKSSKRINMKLKRRALEVIPDNILSLTARSPQYRETLFYSSITAQKPGLFAKIPKLILEYEVNPFPFRSDWAQAFSTAQHDRYLNWNTNAVITQPLMHSLPNPYNYRIVGADPTGAIAVYKNQPIIFTGSADGSKAAVKQLNAGGDVLWSQDVDNIIKSRPLIDERGRLYYISSSNTLTILDLNNSGGILFSKALSTIVGNQITLEGDATLGYDGTLYLSSIFGTAAISAYPQMRLRWKYENKKYERNGPVSLSADESHAFFINVNTQQETSRLVMLDNTDGSELDGSESILGGYKDKDGNYYIPAPVVEENKNVFVLNGYDESNRLFIFKIKSASLSEPKIVDSKQGENTGISQPALDANGDAYFVFNKKIAHYDPSEPNNVDVYDGSPELHNFSIVVVDKSSNIYVADPHNNAEKVVGFTHNKDFTHNFTEPLNTAIKKSLVLAPDGTLYTITANNVIAITAKEVDVDQITLSKLKTNTVYRATNTITLTGFSVLPSVNTILYSGGGMGLKPGFSVRKGASVTFKTFAKEHQ